MTANSARPNRELVVYALGVLGGEFQRVHTEDIALKCHELFPDSFSWTRHPKIPDKDIVRVALTDARKERYGQLVEGRAGQTLGNQPDGWTLTEAGVVWFRQEGPNIASYAESRELKGHRQDALRRLGRIQRHRLWKSFSTAPEEFSPSLGDLASLLRCRVDAPGEVWSSRFADLSKDARASENQELDAFIEQCRVAYSEAK